MSSGVNPAQLATAVGAFLLGSPSFTCSGRRRVGAHHRRLSLIPSEAAAGHGSHALTCEDSYKPRANRPGLCHSFASPFLFFLVFHPSVASLSAAESHESNESLLFLLLFIQTPLHLYLQASPLRLSLICLFPVPLFKSSKKR